MVKKRPGHVPERTCLACRTRAAKHELIAFVRDPHGRVLVAVPGRSQGRSAYSCRNERCAGIAVKKLARALKVELGADEQRRLFDEAVELMKSGDAAADEENQSS